MLISCQEWLEDVKKTMSEKKEVTINIDQKMVVALVLGVLVLVAAVQAFQLNGLKSKIASGELSVSASGSSVATQSGGSSAPASTPPSLNELPQMVGGC